MTGVTPESTTAALAAGVPKESEKPSASENGIASATKATENGDAPGAATISSAAPDSTTAELAKDAPIETKNGEGLPGAFPETPAKEPESFSVNPIPATAGIGNPVQLQPGEKVPDPSTLTDNTVESTARTDKAGYEADASAAGFAAPGGEKGTTGGGAFAVPPISDNMIPESSLPIGANPGDTTDKGPTIQSAAPMATTAALAAGVPLETRGKAAAGENGTTASEVPEVVKDSLSEADKEPEAAASGEAVGEKKEVEQELLKNVPTEQSAGTPAPTAAAVTNGTPATDVPGVVAGSHAEGGAPLEAATSAEAVAEKKDVENELLNKVPHEEAAGEPAPTTTAATTGAAPVAAATTTPAEPKRTISRDVSPMTKDAPTSSQAATTTQDQPTVTTGATESKTPETSTPAKSTAADEAAAKDKKKKNRASGFFSKLKEKFK